MATITTWEMRLLLDRNPNALDARPVYAAGESLPAGLYWDADRREGVPFAGGGTADRRLISLHEKPDATFDEVVRQVAMGGGGHSGRPVPYEQARAAEKSH
jgi:hypothetical protein